MVDPMDGTREFIEHRDEFSVMIGLAIEGIPVLGVVYQPTAGKLFYAAAGGGAFLDAAGETSPLRVSTEHVASRLVLAESRSHRSARVHAIQERLRIPKSIRSGSVGLKVGMLCEGRAHLYVHTGSRTHLWDTCGPDAILTESGGKLTDIFNARLNYGGRDDRNPNGIVASNGIVHDRAIRAAQDIVGRM
jgi:3'(2'), 5'-bisphosphate nucleotidase